MIAGTCFESECIAAVTLVDGDKFIGGRNSIHQLKTRLVV